MTALTEPSVTLVSTHDATAPARRSERFGVHLIGDGVDVVVSAPFAEQVWLCLLDHGEDGELLLTANTLPFPSE